MDLTVELAKEALLIPELFFRFMEFKEILPMLLDEALPELPKEEQEVVSSVLVAAEEHKEDLEGNMGMGTIFHEPEEGIFVVGAPLPAKLNQAKSTYI